MTEKQQNNIPLKNIPLPVFLFIPNMLGAALLSKLLEHLYPDINPEVFQNCVTGFGAAYMVVLALLWVLFGNELMSPKGKNRSS